MKRLLVLLMVLFGTAAYGQAGARYDGALIDQNGKPVIGVNVRVCTTPASAQPCTPLANVYSDVNLAFPLTNPVTTDFLGNFFFYVTPGTYELEFSGTGLLTKQVPDVSIGLPGNGTNILPLSNVFTGATNTFQMIVATGIQISSFAPNSLICTDGSGHFQTSSCPSSSFNGGNVTNPTTFLSSQFNCGPNMWIDITCYGARAVSSVPQTTATTNGTNVAVFASVTGFQIGDGVSIQGAFTNNTLSQPTFPTVTAVVARVGMNTGDVVAGLTGSTAAQYAIMGRDTGQGVTRCSDVTGTNGLLTTGAATLGPVITNITSMTRANNVVTVTTASPSGAAAGGQIFITNSTDATFSGYYQAATIIDTTHFTYLGGIDTRGGVNVSTAATGGTVTIYNANHLTLPTVAYQYYIYKLNGGNFVYDGIARPGETSWDDWGQAPPARPIWVPAQCSSTPTNDTLSTTITGISGNNVTLAVSASQSISGAIAIHDDGPAFVAAYLAAANSPTSSTVHIPVAATGSSFVINSYTTLTGIATILDENPIVLNDTVATPGGIDWTGMLGGGGRTGSQFSWDYAPPIYIGAAFPAIAATGISDVFNYLSFDAINDNGLMMTINHGGGFNTKISNSSFYHAGSTDTLGMAIVGYGQSVQSFSYDLFSFNDVSTYGSYPTPAVFYRNDVANVNGSGDFYCDYCFWVGRGAAFDSNPTVGSNSHRVFKNNYAQALRMPWVTEGSLNADSVTIDTFHNDTGSSALVANLGASNQLTLSIENTPDNGVETSGIAGLLSGFPAVGYSYTGIATQLGQNVNLNRFRTNASIDALTTTPTAGSLETLDTMVRFGSSYSAFFAMAAPGNVTSSLCNGSPPCAGSIPAGNWVYEAVGFDATGRPTSVSTPTAACAVVSGSQSCTVTIGTASPWAANYSFYRSNGGGYGGVVACANQTSLTCTDTASSQGGGAPPATGTAGSTVLTANGITVPGVYNAAHFPGADFAVQINNCIAATILYGGICDARAFAGPQTATHGIVAGSATGGKGLLMLPTQGLWTFTLTGGTSPMLLRYPDYAVWGSSAPNNLVLKNASANGGASACYEEIGEGLSGGDYGLSGGFQCAQSSTTSVGYASQTIDSNTFKVNCLFESGQDGTYSQNIGCFDASTVDTNNVLIIAPTSGEKPGFTHTYANLVGNSLGTGPTVLEIYGSSTVGSPPAVSLINTSMTHPGPGNYNILLQDTNATPTMSADFGGTTYFESATGNDQTTDEFRVNGAASVTIANLTCTANNTGGNRTGNCVHITTQNPNTQLFIGSAMAKSGSANWTYPMTMVADDNNPNSPLTLSAAGISKSYNTTLLVQNQTIGESLYVPAATSGNNIAIGTTNSGCGTNLLCVGASEILMNSIGGALFPGALKFGTSFTANAAGSHFNTTGASNDIVGSIVITNPATSGSATFTTPYNSAPICIAQATADPTGTVGFTWVSTSPTAVTINVHATPSSTSTYFYQCWGHPN